MHPVRSFTPLTRRGDTARPTTPCAAKRPVRHLRAVCGLLALGACSATLLASAARAGVVNWKLNQNGTWNVAANWDTGVVPGSADDVFNQFANAVITFTTNDTINSFLSQGAFNLNGGTLTGSLANSASIIQVNNVFTFNGGSLNNFTVNQGTGGTVTFTGNTSNYISNVIFNSAVNMSNGFTEVYNGGNQFNGVTTFSGGRARLHDINAALAIGSNGTLTGYGTLDQLNNGAILTNNGTINANSNGNTLTLAPSTINGSGTFTGSNGGILSIGGFLNGNNITVLAGATAADGVVQIDGGGLGGSIATATGTGISFTGNSNNYISSAAVNGNVTFGSGAFAEVYGGGNQFNGVSTFSGGRARLHDINAALAIGSNGTLTGYGTLDQLNNGAILTNNGTINANSNGNTLTLAPSTINGSGTFTGSNGGILSIGGFLNGNNITVHADVGTVQIDGGGLGGTLANSTGTGVSFTSNSNNYINNAIINGNATFAGGFAEMYNGSNAISGILTMAGGRVRLHDGNAMFTVNGTGSVLGFGTIDQLNSGATLTNNGTINANSSGNALTLAPSTINGSGTFQATNGGTLSFGGSLIGSHATIHADAGTVQIDGGGLNGTFDASTGSGISFTGNSNNYIGYNAAAVVNGNVTFGSGAFAEVYGGGNQFNGVSTFSGGRARLHDINAALAIGSNGTLTGYGTIDQLNSGATLTNNGTINANSSGNALTINTGHIAGTGTFQGSNGGVLSIGGFLNGNNITVLAGATAADGVVQIDGGGLGGSIATATGTGISFTGNSNNYISSAAVNGNVTFGSGAFAEVYGGGNQFNGVTTFSGGRARLNDTNVYLVIGSNGTLTGYGTIDQLNSGATIFNNGTINANVNGQTLTIAPSAINGIGTYIGSNGGTLSIGGLLDSNNANVYADSGTVQVDGGGIGGIFATATGTGISFTNNSNNNIDAVVNGNVTFGSGAFAEVYGNSQFNGVTTFSGGHARLHDINAALTIGSNGALTGYGTIDQLNSSATLTNNGTINANSSGNTLTLGTSNFTNNGTTEATNGATLTVTPNVANTGTILVESGSTANFNGGVTQTAGQTTINGTASASGINFNLQGGSFVGDGALTGPLNNTGGTVSPGSLNTAGKLTVNGNYSQDANSSLLIKRRRHDPGNQLRPPQRVQRRLAARKPRRAVAWRFRAVCW